MNIVIIMLEVLCRRIFGRTFYKGFIITTEGKCLGYYTYWGRDKLMKKHEGSCDSNTTY